MLLCNDKSNQNSSQLLSIGLGPQTLHVEVLRVSQERLCEVAAGPETRWLDDDEVAAAAVPTQMKKVFKAAVAALSGGGAGAGAKERGEKRKRRDSPGDSSASKKMAPIMERFLLKGTQKTGVAGN